MQAQLSSHLTKGLSYESYRRLRSGGDRAIDIYNVWKEEAVRLDSMDPWHALARVMMATVGGMYIMFKYWKSAYIKDHKIWITSATGKTTVQLPLSIALRVIRTQNWKFADGEPIRRITRRGAMRILLFGDRAI